MNDQDSFDQNIIHDVVSSLNYNDPNPTRDDNNKNDATTNVTKTPNKLLVIEEIEMKKELKRLLKQQMRERKLEVRLQQAISRKDEYWIHKGTIELNEFRMKYNKNNNNFEQQNDDGYVINEYNCNDERKINFHWSLWSNENITLPERIARNMVENINQTLQQTLLSNVTENLHTQHQQNGVVNPLPVEDDGKRYQNFPDSFRIEKKNNICDETNDSSISQEVVQPVEKPVNNKKDIIRQQKHQKKLNCYRRSRELCKHMTKGTQTEDMFNDYDALIGYTRTKFIERSTLIIQSLFRLLFSASSNHNNNNNNHDNIIHKQIHNTYNVRKILYNVQTICSIGCGPGCDAIGAYCFLKSIQWNDDNNDDNNRSDTKSSSLKKIIFMDYAIDRWKDILSSIRDMLLRNDDECNNNEKALLQKVVSSSSIEVDMVYCDVRKPIEDHTVFHNKYCNNNKGHTNGESNANQNTLLSRNYIIAGETATTEYTDDTEIRNDGHLNHNNSNQHVSIKEREHNIISNSYVDDMLCNATNDFCSSSDNIDLVIISYLFSETRNQWQIFMDGFIHNILRRQQQQQQRHLQYNKDCTTANNRYKTPMILVTDPTAWQLHIFKERYNNIFDFMWLDSSMYRPELQALEGRVGPAVLLGIMKV